MESGYAELYITLTELLRNEKKRIYTRRHYGIGAFSAVSNAYIYAIYVDYLFGGTILRLLYVNPTCKRNDDVKAFYRFSILRTMADGKESEYDVYRLVRIR